MVPPMWAEVVMVVAFGAWRELAVDVAVAGVAVVGGVEEAFRHRRGTSFALDARRVD